MAPIYESKIIILIYLLAYLGRPIWSACVIWNITKIIIFLKKDIGQWDSVRHFEDYM